MKAILLAAGFGTRLRPLTDTIPKCLVPIKGIPLLEIWLDRLSAAGVDSFLINTHYLHEQVKEFIKKSSYNDKVTLFYEPELLGTAGTLNANIDFFKGQDGMLIHSDNYCLADIHEFINAHVNRPKVCVMTMMTFKTENPTQCGIIQLDENNIVTGMQEKVSNPDGNLANGAFYILSGDFQNYMRNELSTTTDLSNEVLPTLMHKIYSYQTYKTFIDIGTPQTYQKANELVV
jgi:mannose-1-phosphate guanylyltransferase